MTNRPSVQAGLARPEAGGDLAAGVIASEGEWLGGSTFASFDKTAVRLLEVQGLAGKLLGSIVRRSRAASDEMEPPAD